MPHMIIDYSANLDDAVEMQAFCAAMRDAMIATAMFPIGGIRVRALPCQAYTIADGDPTYAYLHMTVRVGHGRPEEIRLAAADTLYAAAEAHLMPLVGKRPFALSLDLDELHPVTSLKRFNTVHAAVKARLEA